MKTVFAAALALASMTAPATAQSCYDLWYQRNEIFAENGFCFSTDLAQRTFSQYSCWTKNPALTNGERRAIEQIKAEEKRRGCKVNQ